MRKYMGGELYFLVIDKAGFREMLTSEQFSDLCFDVAGKVADRLNTGGKSTFQAQRWSRPSRAAANVVTNDEGAKFRDASTGEYSRTVRSMKL